MNTCSTPTLDHSIYSLIVVGTQPVNILEKCLDLEDR